MTKYRSKPAVPLGAKYRLIDVPISNCLNSGFSRIIVLTQYNSQSLNNHISQTYRFDSVTGGFVEVLAASQTYERTEWFQGTADSVRQTLPHITDPKVNEVAVLSGDQLYMMDLKRIQAFHHEKKAEITVACYPVPREDIHRFGVMEVDSGGRITSFIEKPKDASLIRQKPVKINGKDHYLINMGIYFFDRDALVQVLTESNKDDFGREIIPEAIQKKRVYAYTYEGYWSDVGTIESYYAANLMMAEKLPSFNLYDEEWRVFTHPRHLPPAKMSDCSIQQSIIAEGCIITEVEIRNSVIGIRSRVGPKTKIRESILAGNDFYGPRLGIGKNCVIQKAIIDKNVSIGDNVKIVNRKNVREAEGEGYSIRDGIVVIHKGAVLPDGTVI